MPRPIKTTPISHTVNTKKLRGISLNELLVRTLQLVSTFAERNGWSGLTKVPTDETLLGMLHLESAGVRPEGLLRRFVARTEPRFFAAFTNREATIQEMRSRWPEAESEIVRTANAIVDSRFDLLGFRNLSFGNPIDWHLEPISGKRAPSIHWSRLNFLDAELAGDKKIVWELNRHQYFATLGQAFWLTGNEKYAQTFVTHINSWMDQNPPKLGINWASSLEVAFRSISWIWAFYFFKESPALNAQTFLRALKFLYLSARHVETYLSTYFSPNTHLTGEALGLFYLGTLLPEFRESDGWRRTGLRILTEQLSRHVKPDGVYFEQSSYYHRYTTDFYTHLFILLRVNGQAMPVELEAKLGSLLDHLMYITRPDGTTPLFGDDDGGRLVTLDRPASNDFRGALSSGAALFRRSDYKYVSDGAAEEALWLLGPDGLRELDLIESREPVRQSVAFADGGYYVMRDGWSASANYLLFDCGPHGTLNCGHAHADALSFDLATRGHTMLVDPGTYTYTGSKEMRDWFRSSAAHNTLTVDDESSSVSDGPFSWKTVARCEQLNWIGEDRFDYVEGQHDGYARLPEPATHTRAILFLKRDYWVLRDRVISAGDHRLDVHFHFDPSRSVDIDNGSARISANSERPGLETVTFASNGGWRKEVGWVSNCYGERQPAPVGVFSAKGSAEIVTFLLPRFEDQASKNSVREVEAIGGKAFEITSENTLDIVMIGNGTRVEMSRLASDCEWIWARFSGSGSRVPEEFVIIGGHTLELEGREILKSARRINYLVATRTRDQFHLKTDDGILDLSLPIKDFDFAFSNLKSQS
jgi:hypothetical protein